MLDAEALVYLFFKVSTDSEIKFLKQPQFYGERGDVCTHLDFVQVK